ncbi:hypothetical protein C3K47_17525 [Solitalea longa]|uniref:Glycosyl transferase family 1 domain-containing protein n=1 Tax=Solitalea longa TaxID=2079460 RepID=A0A2S4ZX06_9SPHI|nr:glycosyltransferase family 4 protein [Solitalea longa]POY34904.1 hypothetical protein C3K47_17525 [Solitalea longa]
MALTIQKIIAQYNFFKNCATRYFNLGQIEKASNYCEVAARIGYKYNFRYSDDELESIVEKISKSVIPDSINFNPVVNRIVFYDSFAQDNRGLTQQYLRAIIGWNSELLFITPKTHIGKDILDELKSYSKTRILQIDSSISFSSQVISTIKEIERFRPQYVFQHFSPWDILGFTIWNGIKCADRFLINLTDHAYWLGKYSTDYFLEFRKYGCYLSIHQRKIDINKLLFQPYYPIQNENNFLGFPILKENKIFAFAGSSFYKIYGRNGLFLNLILELLDNNPDVIFLLAGNGNDKPIQSFIKKHKLENRFILLGNRPDINEVIKNIDIYINTFPMIGGLMSQFAAVNNKPIIGYTDIELYSFNDTEDFLQINNANTLVKTNVNDFLHSFKELVNNELVRAQNIELTKNSVITPYEFSKLLLNTLTNKRPVSENFTHESIINLDSVTALYLDMEIHFLHDHNQIIWNTINYKLFRDDFKLATHVFIDRLINKIHQSSKKIIEFLK